MSDRTEQGQTVEEIQRRLMERRAQQPAPASLSAEALTRKVEVACPVCGDTHAITQFRPHAGGRWMPGGDPPPPSPCDACAEIQRTTAEREQKRLVEMEAESRRAKVLEERERSILDLLDAAGVNTAEHGGATLENFDASRCGYGPVDTVRRLLNETRTATKHTPVRGVYLLGQTGAGKSHLAVAVVRALLLDPSFRVEDVVYDVSLELIGEIQDTYTTGASAKAVLAKRKKARLWVLDDFGTENPSNDVVRRLTEIFTARAMRPTLVTSNVDPNDIEQKHPELFRLFSRLGPAYFDVKRVAGIDRRMEAA